MMRFYKYLLLVSLAAGHGFISAQDVQFSQPYSAPMLLNPAFAGSSAATRFALNYRNQWPGLDHNYQAMGAGADFFVKELRGGLGISFVRDVAGTHKLSNTQVAVKYSQHIALSRWSNLAVGIEGGYGQRQFDSSKLLFADQVINESNFSQDERGAFPATYYGDLSAGIMYYNEDLWVGFSMHHLNRPNQSLLGGEDRIPTKFSVHGGWILPIAAHKESQNGKSLRLMVNYKAQGKWDQTDLGMMYSVKGINMGLWYRGIPFKPYEPGYQNNESLVLLLGYEFKSGLSIGYSYDLTLSRLAAHSGGAHEIAVIYEVMNSRKKLRKRIVPCAKF